MKSFTVIGGDKRNIALAELLCSQGYSVKLFGFEEFGVESHMQCKNLKEAIDTATYIIGPTPCSHNGVTLNTPFHGQPLYIESVMRLMDKDQVFIAGYVKKEVYDFSSKFGIKVIDILEREELLVLNAIPTAEGALKIAIDETDITLHDSKTMVIGYGRVGTVLSKMLAGIGSKVKVVSNTMHGIAQAKSVGLRAINFTDMNAHLSQVDIIFNTVPEILLDKSNMHFLNKNVLIIDIASPPYGVDINVGLNLGLKILFAGSLPGKVAPVTTANYMLSSINQVIESELGVKS